MDKVSAAAMQHIWFAGYMRRQYEKTDAAIDRTVRAVSYVSNDARYPGQYVRMEK